MATYNQVTPEIIEQLKAAAPGHVFTGEDINPENIRNSLGTEDDQQEVKGENV